MDDEVEFPGLRVQFGGYACKVYAGRYATTGNLRLNLYADGVPVATASINLDSTMPDDRVMIKDYSENRGMFKALSSAGVIGDIDEEYADCSFCVYELLVPLPTGLVQREVVCASRVFHE